MRSGEALLQESILAEPSIGEFDSESQTKQNDVLSAA
jgi:hypothetical protein